MLVLVVAQQIFKTDAGCFHFDIIFSNNSRDTLTFFHSHIIRGKQSYSIWAGSNISQESHIQ
jgi:hypothetical protein